MRSNASVAFVGFFFFFFLFQYGTLPQQHIRCCPVARKKEKTMKFFDYYWCTIELEFVMVQGHYGLCRWYPEYSHAEIKISSHEDTETWVHELGHVWQGLKFNNLETHIAWPEGHLGSSSDREDFPECLRVAICGLCEDADESLLYKAKQGVAGIYLQPITQKEKEAFVSLCKAEVIRLLGFIPDIPKI